MDQPSGQIVSILLFRENGELVLLHNEKEAAPNICTLIGGKSGDVDNKLNEKQNPWIALYREIEEEAGYPVKPGHLMKIFDLTYNRGRTVMHVFTGTITDSEFEKMNPPNGSIMTCDINALDADPMKNLESPITPLHNYIVQLYKEHKNQVAPNVHHTTNKRFMPVEDFSKIIALHQSRLQFG